jgi:tetratricopeptide (TPR) repeat protein
MTEWISLLAAAGAGVIASLASSFIVDRMRRRKDVVYDVAFASGKRQEVRVPKSQAGDLDSSIQEAILVALNHMRSDNMNPRSTDELKRLVAELEKQRAVTPLSRRLALLLSRAYWNLGDSQKAIEILSEFITSKEQQRQLDKDLADVYYNLACYLALTGQESSAVNSLKRSISLNPDRIESAKVDPDLSSIREHFPEILTVSRTS